MSAIFTPLSIAPDSLRGNIALSLSYDFANRLSLEGITVESFFRATAGTARFILLSDDPPRSNLQSLWPLLTVQCFSAPALAAHWQLDSGLRNCSGLPSCLTGRHRGRWLNPADTMAGLEPEPPGQLSAVCFRFLLWLSFLRQLTTPAVSNVLLIDLKDVLFQSDPFHDGWLAGATSEVLLSAEIASFSARRAFTWNYRAVALNYPGAIRPSGPVINSGFTLGGRDQMITHLQRVSATVLQATHRWTGADQAAYKVVQQQAAPSTYKVLDAASGMLVMHYVPSSWYYWNQTDGFVWASRDGAPTGWAGRPWRVLHQWDRASRALQAHIVCSMMSAGEWAKSAAVQSSVPKHCHTRPSAPKHSSYIHVKH